MTFQFDREEDGSLSLQSAVYQAIGAASMTWPEVGGTFKDDVAREIAEGLLGFIGKRFVNAADLSMDPRQYVNTGQFVQLQLRGGHTVGGLITAVGNGLVQLGTPPVAYEKAVTTFHQRDIVSIRKAGS